jgi:glycosyltransferase involved in cell wall biosynthesis
MTSTYEGFGLVNLDAMRQHLPVVAYDLPVYEPIKKAIVTVPILRNDIFSQKVLELLKDKRYYEEQSNKAYLRSLKFSWDKMGSEILSLIKR